MSSIVINGISTEISVFDCEISLRCYCKSPGTLQIDRGSNIGILTKSEDFWSLNNVLE